MSVSVIPQTKTSVKHHMPEFTYRGNNAIACLKKPTYLNFLPTPQKISAQARYHPTPTPTPTLEKAIRYMVKCTRLLISYASIHWFCIFKIGDGVVWDIMGIQQFFTLWGKHRFTGLLWGDRWISLTKWCRIKSESVPMSWMCSWFRIIQPLHGQRSIPRKTYHSKNFM